MSASIKTSCQRKHGQDVDPGISAKLDIADLKKNGKARDNQIFKFNRDTVSFLSTLCAHLAEKSLIKFPMSRNSRCFIPSLLVESPDVSETHFNRLLENIVSTRQLPECYAEEAKQEFPKFLSMVKERRKDFVEFDVTAESHHLDTFYWKLLEDTCSFRNLAVVLKIILTLSHGQASVERGFSVSKSLLVKNLATKSLTAQRIVYDYMKVNDVSAEDVEICPTLCCIKHDRQRHSTYLEEQKKNKVKNDRSLKRKKTQDETAAVNKKKSILNNKIRGLRNDADMYAVDAEKVSKIEDMKPLLLESNLFQKSAKEKNEVLNQFESILKELSEKKDDLV